MEEKVPVKKRGVPRIVPWEPYKAATSAYAKGSHPNVLPPLVKYQLKPLLAVSENKPKLEITEKRFLENVDSREMEVFDLSKVRPVEKKSLSLGGGIEVGKEENSGDAEELRRLKKDLELERQLTEELKRILVATMGDDLSCYVKALSEDKVHLAHMLSQFEAQKSRDLDKVGDLANLADMWRCKFFAISIRADEMRNQRFRLLSHCRQLQTLLNKFLVTNEDQLQRKSTTPALEALMNEARAALKTDLSAFVERSPCDEKIYKPVPQTSNITITCCKHCIGREIKLI